MALILRIVRARFIIRKLYFGSMSDRNRPDPCENCKPKLLKIAVGETYECPKCGVEWASDVAGVWLADEMDDDGIHPKTRNMDDVILE
jgi:ribosomal protein L37AE/L43A